MADLPRAVHLVAEAPEAHVVGVFRAVRTAQVGQGRAARHVAALHPVRGILDAPGAEVDGEHGVGPGRTAPGDELVGADRVALDAAPGEVDATRALFARADAVLSVVV